MGIIKKIASLMIATTGGIYLSSKEGSNMRKNLGNSFANFLPVIQDLTQKVEDIVTGTKKIESSEIRTNVEIQVANIKKLLTKIDPKQVGEKTEKIIQQVSKSVRKLRKQMGVSTLTVFKKNANNRSKYSSMSIKKLREIAKTKKITIKKEMSKHSIVVKLIEKDSKVS